MSLAVMLDLIGLGLGGLGQGVLPSLQMRPGDIDPELRASRPTMSLRPFDESITVMLERYAAAYGLPSSAIPAMRGYFVTTVNQWFRRFMAEFFPEKTGALIASYWERWTAGIVDDRLVIESDLKYAKYVEAMFGVEWSKDTAIDFAASVAEQDLEMRIDEFMYEAAMEAMQS